MRIDGTTRTCGLIGNPVGHTLSPLIHNTLAELTGIPLVYVPFLVEQERLGEAVTGAYALNLLGLNVTVPYKTEVMAYLSDTDELAARIGSVNTLVRAGGGYRGYNTDMEGLYRALLSEGIRPEGQDILLLGAGGAARAVAYLCASRGAGKLYLWNRTAPRADTLAAEVNRAFGWGRAETLKDGEWDKLPPEGVLAIQCTSAGLYPRTGEAPVTDPALYGRIHTGFDLIYRPAKTRFLSLVEQAGGKACNGLKMLLYQGVIAFELWNQITVEEQDAAYVCRKLLEV